jgi:Domain of unknown function (DUF4062)
MTPPSSGRGRTGRWTTAYAASVSRRTDARGRTIRIYLSSTYVDLVEHRAAVARVLRQMGHEVIGMEEYVAEGARPIDRCLADVSACDLYVGVFAW